MEGLFYLTSNAEAARATTLILGKSKPEPKIDTIPTAEEENVSVSGPVSGDLSNDTVNAGNVTKLTGVPQIDYIYDPNLPRELNGYNLTDYPFYNSVPEDIDFKCDGLHDGFYASVPHKCQVYHHCLFGTRYDFLCANYTAFDQKTFICHFASEVDCKNSPRYFNRNEALYKATTTTTVAPFGSSALAGRRPQEDSHGGRRRRPFSRRRKPSYEYYDEYEESAEDDYYDEASPSSRRRKRPRPFNGRDSYEEEEEEGDKPPPSGPNKSVYDRPRVAPKIRRPVPINEREKYDYSSDSRVIAKEPVVEKKRIEDAETASRKQVQGINRPLDSYESTGSGHSKNKEVDTEREREREHKGEEEYESEREWEKERERERNKERERDERPYRNRRPPKKRRRPDDLDDYDEYDDVRRYRPRNRPRYEEYDDYEYDDRPHRNSQRSKEQDYRQRDHDYDRDKPYRSRDSDYDRPLRNRERLRDDDRPLRNRDSEIRGTRNRDEERPPRTRDEERPIRNRDTEQQSFRSDGKIKNRNRESEDERHYYGEDEEIYRGGVENKRGKETYRDEGKKPGDEERQQKYEGEYKKQTEEQSYIRPSRYRDSTDKLPRNRNPSYRETAIEEDEAKVRGDRPDGIEYSEKQRFAEQPERPSLKDNERGGLRAGNVQRTRPSSTSPNEEGPVNDQSKPVPASRPAYITRPLETVTSPSRKPFNDQSNRKGSGFKRPFLPRIPTAQEDSREEYDSPRPNSPPKEPVRQTTEPYEDKYVERPNDEESEPEQQNPKPFRFAHLANFKVGAEKAEEKYEPEDAPQADFNQQRLKVPDEESVPREELAPRAPKFPQTSPRRRPFLPSRNGNANLPRGLFPVGGKAYQTPRGFQAQNKKEEQQQGTSKAENSEQETPDQRYVFPSNGGLEFRAKLSTAIGVDQPKLTQFFQDVQSSSELELPEYETSQGEGPSSVEVEYYQNPPQNQQRKPEEEDKAEPSGSTSQMRLSNHNIQDSSGSHLVSDYNIGQAFRQEDNVNLNSRPGLKPPEFPQLTNPPPPRMTNDQSFRNRPQPVLEQQKKNPILYPPPQETQGPQSFFSENPKFKTTVKVPEQFAFKSTAPNFSDSSTQLPVYVAGIRQHFPNVKTELLRYDNGQRQVDPPREDLKHFNLKFSPQNENLEDSEEFDISLNDALQPISTLHPRNVPTGVFLSNVQRSPQATGFKRRIYQGPVRQQPSEINQEINGMTPERFRVPTETRNVPNEAKAQKLTVQRQASSSVHQRYVPPPAPPSSPLLPSLSLYHPVRPAPQHGKYFAFLTK